MLFNSTIGTDNLSNREKWLEDILKKIPKGLKILDAGAGELQYKKYCTHLQYISQDFAQYNGKGDGCGLQTGEWDSTNLDIVSDITAIPVDDCSFDAIMSIEVFEHLPEPVKAIKEFQRLLKPGGYLVITAPFCSLTHFAPYHYYSGFNKYFYEKHLSESGFEIIEISPNGNYFSYLAQEIRRIPSCASKYSDTTISRFYKYIIKILLHMLEKVEGKSSDSSELLCFGYNVFAKKIKVDK